MFARLSCAVVDAGTVAAGKASRNCSAKPVGVVAHAKTALVLHGLMGSHRNWLQFTRQLVRTHPSWRFVLVDLPGHGGREGLSHGSCTRPTNLYAAAKDLHDTVALHKAAFPHGWAGVHAAVGHSMGGRLLLKLLQSFPEVCTDRAPAGQGSAPHALRVATLDTMPGSFNYACKDTDQDGVSHVLDFVASMPSSIPSRAWLQLQCTQHGFSQGMARWMGTNLEASRCGAHLHLSFDLKLVRQLLESHHSSDQWSVLQHPPSGCELHAVLATHSSRWRDADVKAHLGKVPGDGVGACLHWMQGGHWLHVDNSAGLKQWLGQNILLSER